jgi:phenylalanyl-tRNA synthetase beta chain
LWLVGHVASESWLQQDQRVSFQSMASAVHKVLGTFRIQNTDSQEITDKTVFANGLTYTLNKKPLVSFGQVNPRLTKLVDIKQPVFYADFDWAFLLKQYSELVKFSEISKFPEVRRDLSLVVAQTVTYQQIRQVAHKYEKELLRETNVFDVYEGDKIEAGKKSYSVSFILQDPTQTLTDKVIDKTMQKLMLGFEKELGVVIRK